MFTLLVEETVLEKIRAAKESRTLIKKLKLLKEDPFPDGHDTKEIKGTRRMVYRLRAGGHRFFYVLDIEEKTIRVTEFLTAEQAHRKYGSL